MGEGASISWLFYQSFRPSGNFLSPLFFYVFLCLLMESFHEVSRQEREKEREKCILVEVYGTIFLWTYPAWGVCVYATTPIYLDTHIHLYLHTHTPSSSVTRKIYRSVSTPTYLSIYQPTLCLSVYLSICG
ncbi:hypothetical protein CSUI_008586, partial [Cystoisospora suis]